MTGWIRWCRVTLASGLLIMAYKIAPPEDRGKLAKLDAQKLVEKREAKDGPAT